MNIKERFIHLLDLDEIKNERDHKISLDRELDSYVLHEVKQNLVSLRSNKRQSIKIITELELERVIDSKYINIFNLPVVYNDHPTNRDPDLLVIEGGYHKDESSIYPILLKIVKS